MVILKLTQVTPNLEIFDLNNFAVLNETSLNMICRHCQELKMVQLNFTPLITDPYLEEMRNTYPSIKFVRNISAHSNPEDNGLRVRFPLKKKAKKKKKKKGKK
jgi:hypothetical protein